MAFFPSWRGGCCGSTESAAPEEGSFTFAVPANARAARPVRLRNQNQPEHPGAEPETKAVAKAEAHASKAKAEAKPLGPMPPTAQATAGATTIRLLESLAKEERVSLPTLSSSFRLRSGRNLLLLVEQHHAARFAPCDRAGLELGLDLGLELASSRDQRHAQLRGDRDVEPAPRRKPPQPVKTASKGATMAIDQLQCVTTSSCKDVPKATTRRVRKHSAERDMPPRLTRQRTGNTQLLTLPTPPPVERTGLSMDMGAVSVTPSIGVAGLDLPHDNRGRARHRGRHQHRERAPHGAPLPHGATEKGRVARAAAPLSAGGAGRAGEGVDAARPGGANAHVRAARVALDLRGEKGAQHSETLEAEAIAARLWHAHPDGHAAGAAELRAVVERMGAFLGAVHQVTITWQGVLEEMIALEEERAEEMIAEGMVSC